jgi:Tfp pilus assembly protein PilE
MPSSSQLVPSHPLILQRARECGSRMRRHGRGGFTLAETMIATLIFCMGILGVYAMLLKSYELVALSRHRDNSRALLVSFADEFLRLQTTDLIATRAVTRDMFAITNAPTGVGLNWTDTTGNQVVGTAAGLPVVLGDSGSSQVPAVVTRAVTNVNSGTGGAVPTVTATAAGWLLQATFTINYQIKGRPQSQSYIVARSVR